MKQMKDKVFIDTNVLIYLYSVDEPDKRQKAILYFFCCKFCKLKKNY